MRLRRSVPGNLPVNVRIVKYISLAGHLKLCRGRSVGLIRVYTSSEELCRACSQYK